MGLAGLERAFGWVCGYLATVATARQNQLVMAGGEEGFVQRVINAISAQVQDSVIPGKPFIQAKILNSLDNCGDWETDEVEKLDEIATFPTPPVSTDDAATIRLAFLQTKYASQRSRLTHVRTVETENHGGLLAGMAEKLVGYFEWVDSRFDSKTQLPVDQISKSGVTTYKNDFIGWLKRVPTEVLQGGYKMNCWEAVLVSAYQAGLITHERLRNLHGFGIGEHGPLSEDAHDRRLQTALGLFNAFPLVKEIDLVPSRGDLMFASDWHHVMICLGPETYDGVPVMSLWNYPQNHFCKTFAESFGGNIFEMKFVPCPF